MRTVFITGVSSGIGKSIAEELAKSKLFYVIGTVRKIEDGLLLKNKYKNLFFPLIMDITDKEQIQNSYIETKKILKKNNSYLCSIINNAGVAFGGPIKYLDTNLFRKQFEINFFGLIEVTNTFLDLLISSNNNNLKNKIINIGSVSGKRAYPFAGPYVASKHALEGLTDSFRRELLIHDIDIVLIQPGPIKTPLWDKVPTVENNPFLKTEYGPALKIFNEKYLKAVIKDGYEPEIISKKIIKILETNNPKSRYVITKNILKNYYIPGFLPDRFIDKLIGKMLKLIK